MLYLDGISLSFLRKDIEERLCKRKIHRIFQNTDTSLSLQFGKQLLVLSCNPQLPICYVTEEKETVLEESVSSFLNSLRKHLMNSLLYQVEQVAWDRTLIFRFSKLTELGEYKQYFLIFELMGRNSNLFLCDRDYKILDLLKHFSLDELPTRNLFPGAKYEALSSSKTAPDKMTASTEKPYFQTVEGVGKLLAEALETPEDLQNILQEAPKIHLYRKKGKIVLLNFLGLAPKDYDECLSFSDLQKAILFYFQEENIFASLVKLRKQLETQVLKRKKKVEQILKKIETDEIQHANFEVWKEKGDILASSLFQIKKGQDSCEAFDFYHNEMISIPLDPRKTPQENLEYCYKKYNKAKTTLVYARKRKEEMQKELSYLDSVLAFLYSADNIEVLKGIEEECIQAGYIKPKIKKGYRKKKKAEKKYAVIEYPNYSLFYGRNHSENDFLSFQVAEKEEYWFHAKNIPGSHVILRSFVPVEEEMIQRACQVAAFHSKAELGDKVLVDYTQKKYLKKPKDSKPGFVSYTHEKGIWVVKEAL